MDVTPKKTIRKPAWLPDRIPKAAPEFRMYVILKMSGMMAIDSCKRIPRLTCHFVN